VGFKHVHTGKKETGQVKELMIKYGQIVQLFRDGDFKSEEGEYGFTKKDIPIYVCLHSDFRGNTFKLPTLNKGQKAFRVHIVCSLTSDYAIKKVNLFNHFFVRMLFYNDNRRNGRNSWHHCYCGVVDIFQPCS
jgi:hypothetical protein